MSSVKTVFTFLLKNGRTCKKNIQQGLSLIEAAMVLALSAIVVAGVIAYYQSASDNQKTEATIAMLTSLISVIHTTYASQPDYEGLSAEILAATGALPASMIGDGGKSLSAPGGSVVTVGEGGYGSRKNEKSYFKIEFGVSENMCPILTRLDLGSSLVGYYIGSTETGGEGGGKKGYTKPLDVKKSQEICKAANRGNSTKDQVTMYYEFN